MKTVALVFALFLSVALAHPKLHEDSSRCSDEEDGTRFPNMEHCQKYVECFNGKEMPKDCNGYNKFDAITLQCTDEYGAVCFEVPFTMKEAIAKKRTTTTKKPTTTTTTTTTTRKPTTTTTTTKKPTTTRKPTTTTTKRTTTKKPTTTTPIPTTTPQPTCNTRFAQDCAYYWNCANGSPTLEICFDGYIYYEPLRSCLPGDIRTCELYHV